MREVNFRTIDKLFIKMSINDKFWVIGALFFIAITCIGVIGTGAAPVEVFDLVMDGLATGGLTVLSLNDHALAEPRFEAKLASYMSTGRAKLLFQDYGPHIPGINLNANVYVLEKT